MPRHHPGVGFVEDGAGTEVQGWWRVGIGVAFCFGWCIKSLFLLVLHLGLACRPLQCWCFKLFFAFFGDLGGKGLGTEES